MARPHPSVPVLAAAALAAALATALSWAPAGAQTRQAESAQPPPPPAPDYTDNIVAVVNGDVITRNDVANRARLFALSSGLPIQPEVLDRLRPQIKRQLIDEKLRMQEIQHRKIVVPDEDVANAIDEIEQRNGMKKGQLRQQLAGHGVAPTTLIAQIRVQLGWTRVLRQDLGLRARISPNEITDQARIKKQQQGQPEYQVSEIFVAAEGPAHNAEAEKFAETVIQQLHAGAPFGVLAAEFSQSETALQGGDLGWVLREQLDPPVAALVDQMPQGAISNPVKVAGGFDIVTLSGKRTVGSDMATVLDLRQAFAPFTEKLNPQAPTPEQKHALERMQAVAKSATSCADIEAADKEFGNVRPANPGEVRADHLNPQMASLIGSLAVNQPSRAIVTPDGIIVLMVCARSTKNMAETSTGDLANQLLEKRVELASQQLLQDLRRRALIDQRPT